MTQLQGEHYFKSMQFMGEWGEKIRQADSVEAVNIVAMEAGGNERSDWEQIKDQVNRHQGCGHTRHPLHHSSGEGAGNI